MAVTLGAMWRAGRDRLAAAGIEGASRDARLLAEFAIGFDALQLSTREREEAPEQATILYNSLIEKRASGMPVARLTNEQWFYGLAFQLSPATLVPRPETEALVDLALAMLGAQEAPRFLDLGTGSGCIGVSIAANLPRVTGVATDLSVEALRVAADNARRHGVADRLKFLEGEWFRALDELHSFDLIVSNPPYIQSDVITGLAREVREHDPLLALDGGTDGLDAYRQLAAEAGRYLRPRGKLAVEIGFDQGEAVSALFEEAGFADVIIEKDLAGLDRIVSGKHL
ncbi:release factor glutamine methyltransferase [Devosia pacifica]|uniref:Release factor glutamine methyltransferase n=1 Tax=Devosia pacifica TaxID=1335967 RepID=A0A918SGB4_9HYPH|nr:peptide chain release factor N(5)-glutamine methyltransferase [Devosia pacifica]GHA37747.1 release factor glutamine methyltransferase [Devosia pacifica]